MASSRNGSGLPLVVVDLGTQADFLLPDGANRVANADELLPNVRHVVAWTKWRQLPVVSTIESHRDGEVDHDGPIRYCLDGTQGQQKLFFTLMNASVRVEGDNTLGVPTDLFDQYQQVIFRQRTRDLLSNPKADRFLTHLSVRRFVLYGVALETSVKALALGLLARHRHVSVVVDACGYWNAMEADLAIRQMAAKGVQIISVSDLLAEKLRRRTRYALPASLKGRNGNGHRGNGRQTLRGVVRHNRGPNGHHGKGTIGPNGQRHTGTGKQAARSRSLS